MRTPTTLLAAALVLAACGGGAEPERPASAPASGGGAPPELTQVQMEKGIGPVTEVELGPVDASLAEQGRQLFETRCTACHRLDERYTGPPLGDVLQRRSPEFVMNMILNSQEMVQRHPAVRELLAEYYTPMPDQGLTEPEARAIVEYLRTVSGGG